MKITDIIKAALFTPSGTRNGQPIWGLNLLLWGDPGVGKTHRIGEVAEGCGLPMEVLSPGERGEGAFGVVPVPNADLSQINYPPPSWVENVTPAGIVFLDEANQASPALQPAIMGIALAKRIGGYQLSNRTRVIAAANPPEKAAGGWDLAAPVANRFGHLDWEAPDVASWADYMVGGAGSDQADILISALDLEKRVLAAWSPAFAEAVGLVTAFCRAKGGILHQMPQVGDNKVGKAWPSPRTWEMATRALAGGKIHALGEVEQEEFVTAFIGEGAASELWTYREKVDLPNPAEVLDGKTKWKHDPKRLDRTEAVLNACAALVVGMDKTDAARKQRADAMWAILGDKAIVDDAMDLAFLPAKALALANLHTTKGAMPVLKKMLPVLQAAGVTFQP